MLTPEQIAKSGSEDAHQSALFAWAALAGIPELRWMHAIPNGGARNAITAARMKATGVKSGVWDILLPVRSGRYAGFYIELKKPGREREKNGGLSDEQIEFGEWVKSQGYACSVHYSWDTAAEDIRGYLAYGAT